jgi:hypothetical protein
VEAPDVPSAPRTLNKEKWARRTLKSGRPPTEVKVNTETTEKKTETRQPRKEPPLQQRRNDERTQAANEEDENLLGKYLSSDAFSIFPHVPIAPDDTATVPSPEFLKSVAYVAALEAPAPSPPPFMFDPNNLLQSARHNTSILEDYGFDLDRLFAAHSDSTVGYGSEFRPIDQLDRVLGGHPNYPQFRPNVTSGMSFLGKCLPSEEERVRDLELAIAWGNHKSALDHEDEVRLLLAKDVKHGFAVPVTLTAVRRMSGTLVQPAGMVEQFTLDENGVGEVKRRLTHDDSFRVTDESESVNDRLDLDLYPKMVYGWCLPRLLHYIVALRLAFSSLAILIAKFDYSDAYRRVAHSSTAAKQHILVMGSVAFVMLRMTFGGAANPPVWCAFSKMVTDLSNDISADPDWDPSVLHSPQRPKIPLTRHLPASIAVELAREMAFSIPVTTTNRTDAFIDDLVNVALGTPSDLERGGHAVPLAIHVTSRPHAGESEPIPRRNLVQDKKLEAEGAHAKVQIVLGWALNCRVLTIDHDHPPPP